MIFGHNFFSNISFATIAKEICYQIFANKIDPGHISKSILAVEVKKNKDQDVRDRLSVPHRLASELLEDTLTILTGVLFLQLFFRKKRRPVF